MKFFHPLLTLFFVSSLFCEEQKEMDISKISEVMGNLIGKNLQSTGVSLDIDALVRGMKEGCKGKNAAFTEEECLQAITTLQEKALSIEAEKNLTEANEFLKKNAQNKNISTLENGKIQYEILQPGRGNSVQPYNSPIIRYKGTFLNGEVFGASADDEVISLDGTIIGFSKAVTGMKEGEKRKIYIHPDVGYGKKGLSKPNALLVFEVELIKADASANAQAASNAEDAPKNAAKSLQ